MTPRPRTLGRLGDLAQLIAHGESVSEAVRRCGWLSAASAAQTAGRLGRDSLARVLWREAATIRRMGVHAHRVPSPVSA